MNVKIRDILDAGQADKERLVLQVLKDTDIGYYIVLNTTGSEESFATIIKDFYWFPNKKVKVGDLVVLYTKEGSSSETVNKDGTTSHFFYWRLKKTNWNTKNDCAVVVEANTWAVKQPSQP